MRLETTAAPARPEIEEIGTRIKELGPWFHNLNLGGMWTAPDHFLGNYPEVKWRRFQHIIPENLSGKSVLDIGCNAGFYAMEMKRRGAARVVGIDSDEVYLAQARFAACVNGLDIEFRKLSAYDVAALGEQFDLVLFMGVFYHLRHPLLALDLIHEHAAGDLMVFQAMQRGSKEVIDVEKDYPFREEAIFDRPEFPKMHFIEHAYASDPTNWWVPNRACAEALLRSSGFEILNHPEEEVFLCRRGERAGGETVYPATGPRKGGRDD